MLLPALSIPLTLLTALALFITYILYKFYIRPYFSLLYYKKQGAVTLFHPKLLGAITNIVNAQEKGDFFLAYKEILKNKPDTKVVVENFGPSVLVVPIDTELVKEFLKRYDVYQKDKVLHSLLIEAAFGTVVFAEDATWKKKRRMVSGAFNFEFLKHIVPMIVETSQEKFQEWEDSGDLNSVNIVEKLGEITGELTGKFFFGKKFSKQTLKGLPFTTGMQQLLVDMLQELFSILTIVFGTKLIKANILPRHKAINKALKEGKDKCRQMIKETETSNKNENNLLNLLLSQRNNGREEDQLTDEEIVGEFIGLFVAGTDTTSHLLGSAIYFLHKYPDVYKKVKEEVDREFADPSKLDIETINRMEYTSAFLKETMRLGGPVGVLFTRVAVKDDDLCGFKIKKGTLLNIFHDMYHRSEKYYSHPMEIRPERWLGDPAYAQDGHKFDPYAFIPFSAGPRNCVGQHLALIEARILLGLFIKKFDFTFPKDYKFALVPTFTYGPMDPLQPTLKVREK